MTLTRRQFIATGSIGCAGSLLVLKELFAQQAPAPPPATPVFATVRGNVGTFAARGGTIGWLVSPNGVIVVDSQFPDTAQLFLDGMKPRTSRTFDLLINSHHHGDHTGGNKVLQPNAARIVAHANVPGLQKKAAETANTAANQAYADTTFDKEWRQDVGGEAVSAKYYGAAHTSGDIVIRFERANVVHMGDLMSFQRAPRADRPAGASLRNWIVVLENTVRDNPADAIYIFGHSKIGERLTGSRQDLLAMRDHLTALLDFTRKQIAAGLSRDEIIKATAIPGFESYEGTPVALPAAYDELTAR